MTQTMTDLRALAEAATRIVFETDHAYEKVGQIVAVDVQREEVSPDVILALLDERDALRAAVTFDAIPTLLIFANANAGVRVVIDRLRAALGPKP